MRVGERIGSGLDSDSCEGDEGGHAGHDERPDLGVSRPGDPEAQRNGHRAEERGREKGEKDGGYGPARAPCVYTPAAFQSMNPSAPASRAA